MINDTNSIIDINVHIMILVNKVSHLDVFRMLMTGGTWVTHILLLRTHVMIATKPYGLTIDYSVCKNNYVRIRIQLV